MDRELVDGTKIESCFDVIPSCRGRDLETALEAMKGLVDLSCLLLFLLKVGFDSSSIRCLLPSQTRPIHWWQRSRAKQGLCQLRPNCRIHLRQ